MLNQVTPVYVNGREILLIGTAHVSKESVQLVKETIEKENPDIVAVELCEQRHHAIAEKKKWDETDISKVMKEGKGSLFLAQLLLTNFQRRIGDELGVKPGSEMVKALEMAKEKNIPIALVDRDIGITLKRAAAKMSLKEKAKVSYGLISGIFGEEEVTEEMVEKLKEMDVLTEMMEELGKEIPSVKEVLLDERNHYIADKLASLEANKIVAVVGAGHVLGIKELLESKKLSKDEIDKELKELESIPVKKSYKKYVSYALPLSIIAIVAAGFFLRGADFVQDSVVKWILITATCSAIGAALAFAHPFSIITAFVVAPITTIHPLLAAGWFSGYVEARVRKPKVRDFEGLMKINSLKDFWRNGVTRILLVIALTNLGASAGSLIAGLSIFAGIVPKIF
jgi:pheromone shutdown-related protein TraB